VVIAAFGLFFGKSGRGFNAGMYEMLALHKIKSLIKIRFKKRYVKWLIETLHLQNNGRELWYQFFVMAE